MVVSPNALEPQPVLRLPVTEAAPPTDGWEIVIKPVNRISGTVISASCTCGYRSGFQIGRGALQRAATAASRHVCDYHSAEV